MAKRRAVVLDENDEVENVILVDDEAEEPFALPGRSIRIHDGLVDLRWRLDRARGVIESPAVPDPSGGRPDRASGGQ